MANELDDGEFWLPPEFLTDDILVDYKRGNKKVNGEVDSGACFPFDLPCAFGSFEPCSDLSSPVESVMGSTETESDEEDYLAGLTREMARATLNDGFLKSEIGWGYENQKSWAVAGSPQSTLCNVLGGSGCKRGSGHGSPNCPSRVSSPTAAAAVPNRSDAARDLLYAAAREVATMKMFEEANGYYQNRGLLGPLQKPSPVSVPLRGLDLGHGFSSNEAISYKQLQVAQFQQLKQQQMMKQPSSVAAWGQMKTGGNYQQNLRAVHQMSENRARNSNRPLGLSPSAWPTLQQSQQQQQQQQPGSRMRAVFLGNPGTKRECAGTGVFLPRQISNSPAETRKKPACSTVLLPDRVVQALNLNLDTMEAQTQLQLRYNSTFSPDYDAALKYRNTVLVAQRRNFHPQPLNQEVRLPQEWTY